MRLNSYYFVVTVQNYKQKRASQSFFKAEKIQYKRIGIKTVHHIDIQQVGLISHESIEISMD